MRITNYTMTGGQSTGRNYFVERIRSIRTMIVTIITVVFAIVILVYGELILEMVLGLLKIDAAKYEGSIWMWLRWLIGFALYFLMISYNYYILPTEKVKFRQIIPGSIFASAGILVVTAIFMQSMRLRWQTMTCSTAHSHRHSYPDLVFPAGLGAAFGRVVQQGVGRYERRLDRLSGLLS